MAKKKKILKRSPKKALKTAPKPPSVVTVRQSPSAKSDYCSVYITCQDRDEGLRIAQSLVSEKLAACFNMFENITSVYHWGGELEKNTEVALIGKTKNNLKEKLLKRINSLHSYEIPCVVFWAIESGHPPFLNWVNSNTSK